MLLSKWNVLKSGIQVFMNNLILKGFHLFPEWFCIVRYLVQLNYQACMQIALKFVPT